MAGQFGVKETKDLFDLGFALAKAGKEASADGKVNLFDVGHLIAVIGKVGPAFEGAAVAPSELGELDEADAKELLDYVKAKLPEVLEEEKLKKQVFVFVKAGLAVAEAIAISRGV